MNAGLQKYQAASSKVTYTSFYLVYTNVSQACTPPEAPLKQLNTITSRLGRKGNTICTHQLAESVSYDENQKD